MNENLIRNRDNYKKYLLTTLCTFCLTTFAIGVQAENSYYSKTETSSTPGNKVYKIQYSFQVNLLLKQINPQFLWNSLAKLSSFPDRSSETINGIEAAYWIQSQVELMIKESERKDVSIYTV